MTSHRTLLSRLAGALAKQQASPPLAWRACCAVRDLLGADGAVLTLSQQAPLAPGRAGRCATDRRSEELQKLQETLGEGPGIDALGSGRLQVMGLDRVAAARWPRFVPAAERLIGPRGMVWSLPLCPDEQVIGTIGLYRQSPDPLAEPLPAAQFLADAVAAALLRDPGLTPHVRAAAAVTSSDRRSSGERQCRLA